MNDTAEALAELVLRDNPEQPVSRRECPCHSDIRLRFKTEPCRFWAQGLPCPFGQKCTFAHGRTELREKLHLPPKYKTKNCLNFERFGWCNYGDRCQFLHSTRKTTAPNCCRKLSFEQRLNSLEEGRSLVEWGSTAVVVDGMSSRLKIFEKFSGDESDVDWTFKKARHYSM